MGTTLLGFLVTAAAAMISGCRQGKSSYNTAVISFVIIIKWPSSSEKKRLASNLQLYCSGRNLKDDWTISKHGGLFSDIGARARGGKTGEEEDGEGSGREEGKGGDGMEGREGKGRGDDQVMNLSGH